MIGKIKNLVALAMTVTSITGFSAPKEFKAPDNSNIPPHQVPAPDVKMAGFLTAREFAEMAERNFKSETKRNPSGSQRVATEDMLSPEMVEFRDKIIHAKTGEEFYEIIKSYDEKYDSIPASATDLKFVVARMATWLPFRGIAWRMTPMVHKIVVTQQVLVGSLRNIAEQGMINFPDSHVQAQMLFLTMPSVIKDSKGELKFEKRFQYESDFMEFLATRVYASLVTSVKRLEKIPKMVNVGLKGEGKETPVVFDTRIRFGEEAFGDNYDASDRFRVIGEAERFAALARISRRLSAVSSMVSYNWNGHLAARRAIGKEFGIGSAEALLFDMTGTLGSEYVNGPTREKRTNILKKYPTLYKITSSGKSWMKLSYFHLHKSAMYLEKTWENVKKQDMDYVMQLDPEVLMGRREQIEMGMANLKKIAGVCGTIDKLGCDTKVSGAATLIGSMSGDTLAINLKAFYENPPEDLKNLLPVGFSKNKDIEPLEKVEPYKTMDIKTTGKADIMSARLGKDTTTFRNYLYDRAIAWDSSNKGYGVVFPGKSPEGVADAMRIINETRGARMLNNAFSMFIR